MLESFADALGPEISAALSAKGFSDLTAIQKAVLDPALGERDLRITSQTGSGKTVAIGLALRDIAAIRPQKSAGAAGPARPQILILAPTRELAKQVNRELSWLYQKLGSKVVSATGGASYRDELRALASGPTVVVATPGRLLDHIGRGRIDTTGVKAVVLDEADRMLDLGFREDLEQIFANTPEQRRTLLVSATFPREVSELAARVQKNPLHVEGTRLGAANTDIEHVVHLVMRHQRGDALVNLLLASPDEQTLVFARTRADVADITRELSLAGFAVGSLSGEMEQQARDRALASFRSGERRVLVATDVAARGIDVQNVTRVVHAEPPTDPDSYTHRSGRTGRAGRRGTSSLLVQPSAARRVSSLLSSAGVSFRFAPVPTAEQIRRAGDERVYESLTAPLETEPDARLQALAGRLLENAEPVALVARLLQELEREGTTAPREIKVIEAPGQRAPETRRPKAGTARTAHSPAARRAPSHERGTQSGFASFHVSWGAQHSADARRLLAMLCRWGGIEGKDVGSIRIADRHSIVDINSDVAEQFAQNVSQPDPRNPRIKIRPDRGPSAKPAEPRERPAHPRVQRAEAKGVQRAEAKGVQRVEAKAKPKTEVHRRGPKPELRAKPAKYTRRSA